MSDHAPLSEDILIMLGAYVDGALTEDEAAMVDQMCASDPRIAAELEGLFALNADLRGAMDGMLDMPVPPALSSAATPPPVAANTNKAPWSALAASLLIGVALGAGGMWFNNNGGVNPAEQPGTQIASARSWLAEVAEYHQVYARQTRHLVEVPASEQAHIEKWLSKEVGFDFNVPNLESAGWSFQGARLLVAAGKPVAQLIYTDANGGVIALCALQNGAGTPAGPSEKTFGDVHMVAWKSEAGSFAIVGDTPDNLETLALTSAPML